ncbi:MAG TPA: styrene monooxygenase/indole monooxygenase family protein [Gaiellaceae bacterium]|nr:styrene monooxygenase/indole monooxygenase family protein [Gaiellaceae bacterium]
MRRITIVGGGQSGLQLGIGLVQRGYEVTVVSNRSPEEIRDGRVMSSQFMFHTALESERALGIDFWEAECPYTDGLGISVAGPDGQKALSWAYRLDHPGQSVDQRVKFPGWMRHLQEIGGTLVLEDAGVESLERYAGTSDLVVVAAGKGEIAQLFERDPERSPFDRPMRALALTYVTGMTPYEPFTRVSFNIAPGVGEYFVFPALTTTGPCEIMVFEGIPGGPMDCWGDVSTPEEHLAKSLWVLETFFPWEAERCREVALTDPNGILSGRFPPTVRKPVALLPSGLPVLGMADAVVLNDPITGQGSNSAAKCATHYLQRIVERGDDDFDVPWMEETFAGYWEYAQAVTTWTNAFLLPPPEHVLQVLGAAAEVEGVGRAFVNGFDDPRTYFPWLFDPAAAAAFIEEQRVAV